jgi:hypothetical protein
MSVNRILPSLETARNVLNSARHVTIVRSCSDEVQAYMSAMVDSGTHARRAPAFNITLLPAALPVHVGGSGSCRSSLNV